MGKLKKEAPLKTWSRGNAHPTNPNLFYWGKIPRSDKPMWVSAEELARKRALKADNDRKKNGRTAMVDLIAAADAKEALVLKRRSENPWTRWDINPETGLFFEGYVTASGRLYEVWLPEEAIHANNVKQADRNRKGNRTLCEITKGIDDREELVTHKRDTDPWIRWDPHPTDPDLVFSCYTGGAPRGRHTRLSPGNRVYEIWLTHAEVQKACDESLATGRARAQTEEGRESNNAAVRRHKRKKRVAANFKAILTMETKLEKLKNA